MTSLRTGAVRSVPWRSFVAPFAVAIGIAVMGSGCKKDDSAADPNAAQNQAGSTIPSARGPGAGTPAKVVVPESTDINATLGQLSNELRRYVVRTRSVPRTFEEFAAKSQAQIPPPPSGKKYAIEGQTIVLVNR